MKYNKMTSFESILREENVTRELGQIEEWDDDDSSGPFLAAAYYGRAPMLRQLLDKGAKPDAVNRYGWSALHWAVAKNHLETIQSLMDVMANPLLKTKLNDAYNPNCTPRQMAEKEGYTEIARLLQDYEGN